MQPKIKNLQKNLYIKFKSAFKKNTLYYRSLRRHGECSQIKS